MKTKKYNITKAGRKYTDNQGNEKTAWENVGILTEFHKDDGSINRLIEIPAIGLSANAFPFVKMENATTGQTEGKDSDAMPTLNVEDEIKPEDLPF